MKLIVCTDGSEYGDKAVKFAARFAKNFGEELTLQELPEYPGFKPKRDKAQEILSTAKSLAREVSKDLTCHEKIACGPISSEIVRIAEVEDFDLIIIGTRGIRGLKRMLLGSVAEDVIRHAHCPVSIVR